MYCFLGLISTIIMGFLGREAWNDARAWRNMFSWSAAPAAPGAWPAGSGEHCSNPGSSLACRSCAIHPQNTAF